MGKLEYNKANLEEQMDKIVARTMRMDMTWDWPCGVAYYGIAEAYEATKKQEYLNVLKERVDELIELGLPVWTVNTCAMGHCLITLYQAIGEEKYMDLIQFKIAYLRNDALRFGNQYCSIRFLQRMIFRSSVGRIRYLWQRSLCCG